MVRLIKQQEDGVDVEKLCVVLSLSPSMPWILMTFLFVNILLTLTYVIYYITGILFIH